MTEGTAFALIVIACLAAVAIAIPGLVMLGVRGPALSLGAIVPLALAADGIGKLVMRYDETGKRRR
jgi:membrane protein implicated in regulation of membrane protease activity